MPLLVSLPECQLRRVYFNAVVVNPPFQLAFEPDRLDRLVRGEDEEPGLTEVTDSHGDCEASVGQLPDAMPEPLAVKAGPDPGAVIGYPEDDGTPVRRVGHAGHLARQVPGRWFTAIAARPDLPASAATSRFLLDVHLAPLDKVRRLARRETCEDGMHLCFQRVRTEKTISHPRLAPIYLHFPVRKCKWRAAAWLDLGLRNPYATMRLCGPPWVKAARTVRPDAPGRAQARLGELAALDAGEQLAGLDVGRRHPGICLRARSKA